MQIEPAMLQELLAFLRSYNVAALATIRENRAHAATIYYFVDDDLRFYFLTKNETLKFSNLTKEGTVGLVISDAQSLQTVQIEGVGKEVNYVKEYAEVMDKYLQNLSKTGKQWESIPINQMLKSGYYAFVQITPTWIKWTDFANWAHTVKFEQRFS